ncbi:MAG: M56 family metallopeptidase [Chitinophagaceae bacterium]
MGRLLQLFRRAYFQIKLFPKKIFLFLLLGQTKGYLLNLKNFFNNHTSFIVAIWFIIFCFQCLRLCTNLGYVYRIRNYKIYSPPMNWQERCEELKIKLGVQKTVSLLESVLVKVPVVVGYFKPIILLPAGMLANLPYNQVESILLHELAHIKRSDYLVNLLQIFVESIFFFNPSILWISSLIKDEREACCDEIAVKQLDSKSHYIQALVSFQEYAMNSSDYAMAFPGKKNHLMQRIKRIIKNENKKLSSMEKTILCCGIIAITAISALSTKESKAQNETSALVSTIMPTGDTIPIRNFQGTTKASSEKKSTRTRVTTDDNGKEKIIVLESVTGSGRDIKAKLKDNNVIELSINGRIIPKEEFKNYEQEIRTMIEQQQAQAIISKQQASKKISQVNVDKDQNKAESQKNQHIKKDEVQIAYTEDDSHQQVEDILNILKRENIIRGKDGTTFKLTNREFLVNGIRQSEELQKQLSQKYIYKPGDFYTFTSSTGTTDITVHRED